ncbi:hypothetical protein MJO29_016359, partial [Puccinia striiformis f. sp. tritici]
SRPAADVNPHPCPATTFSVASQQNTAKTPTRRAPHTSKGTKLATICGHIEKLRPTPKSFITAFLQHSAINMAFCRRFWGAETGWKSTRGLLDAMQGLICSHVEGKKLWHEWCVSIYSHSHVGPELSSVFTIQATQIVSKEKPSRGVYPEGGYISSTAITQDFFMEDARLAQNQKLTDTMPFLYHLVQDKIHTYDLDDKAMDNEDGRKEACSEADNDEFAMQDASFADESNIEEVQDPELKKQLLALSEQDVNIFEGRSLAISVFTDCSSCSKIACTICAMVAFAGNRRQNALMFMAAGVTERVNAYLN